MDASSWYRHTAILWRFVGLVPGGKGDPEYVAHNLPCLFEGASLGFVEGAGTEKAADAFVHFDTGSLARAGVPTGWTPTAYVDLIGGPGTTTMEQARRIERLDVQSTKGGSYTTFEALLT